MLDFRLQFVKFKLFFLFRKSLVKFRLSFEKRGLSSYERKKSKSFFFSRKGIILVFFRGRLAGKKKVRVKFFLRIQFGFKIRDLFDQGFIVVLLNFLVGKIICVIV